MIRESGPRPVFITVAMLVPFVLTGCSRDINDGGRTRYKDDAGRFSIDVPKGWRVDDFPGLKYKVLFGPSVDSFAANVNFLDETFPGSLEEYVKKNVAALTQLMPGYREIGRSELVTSSGARSVVIAAETRPLNQELLQRFYFVDAGNTKFVLTASRAAGAQDPSDAELDACVRTFEITRL